MSNYEDFTFYILQYFEKQMDSCFPTLLKKDNRHHIIHSCVNSFLSSLLHDITK